VYTGTNPLLEYSPNDGSYLYRIYAGKKAVAEEKGGVVKFYHKDHLGSTRVVTNAAGVKIAEYKFAPYGEKEVSTGAGSDYQFTDKAEDATTGLSYFGARFYDAEVGRFLTADLYTNLPNDERILFKSFDLDNKVLTKGLENPLSQNRYIYCLNNPLNRIDPDGRNPIAIKAVDLVISIAIVGIAVAYQNFVAPALENVGKAIEVVSINLCKRKKHKSIKVLS